MIYLTIALMGLNAAKAILATLGASAGAQKLMDELDSAISSVISVQGQSVTLAELESLRTTKQW